MQIENFLDDFDSWNEKKKHIAFAKKDLLFKEGEIWWSAWGMNVGEEVFGKGEDFRRPVVILKKLSRTSCIVAPITAIQREGSWYFPINPQGNSRWVMMHQIKFISINRLRIRLFSLSQEEFQKLKESVAYLLGFFPKSPPESPPDQWVTPNVLLVYDNDTNIAMAEYEEYCLRA